MEKAQLDKRRKYEICTRSKNSVAQQLGQLKERIKKEKDETYIPASDSSDTEEDDHNLIQLGGFRGGLPINCETLRGSSFSNLRFSNSQKLLLEEQMRMCVQLTTQAFLLSFGCSTYNNQLSCATQHLQRMHLQASLNKCAGKKSCFQCVNLSDALAIVKHFGLRKWQSLEKVDDAKRVLCESKVFMYPDLCPVTMFSKPRTANSNIKINFFGAEDNLIALGLETFGNDLRSVKKIQENYLPCRTAEEIRDRIIHARKYPLRKSVIKHYQELGEQPECTIEITPFDENNIKAPIEQDINDYPKWMDSYVEIFKQNGAYPYFLESNSGITVENNFDIPDKPLCNNLKIKEEFKPNFSKTDLNPHIPVRPCKSKVFAVNKEIDLRQEVCDPTLVNANFNEVAPNLDLDISMSGGIKLSALKKSKPSFMPYNINKLCRKSGNITSNLNPGSDKAMKQEMDFEFDNLNEVNEDLSSNSLTSSCSFKPVIEQVKISSLSQGFSFKQASASHFKDKKVTPYVAAPKSDLLSNKRDKAKTSFKLVTIKLENESDTNLPPTQNENLSTVRKDLLNTISSCEIFPNIKIEEESF